MMSPIAVFAFAKITMNKRVKMQPNKKLKAWLKKNKRLIDNKNDRTYRERII